VAVARADAVRTADTDGLEDARAEAESDAEPDDDRVGDGDSEPRAEADALCELPAEFVLAAEPVGETVPDVDGDDESVALDALGVALCGPERDGVTLAVVDAVERAESDGEGEFDAHAE